MEGMERGRREEGREKERDTDCEANIRKNQLLLMPMECGNVDQKFWGKNRFQDRKSNQVR